MIEDKIDIRKQKRSSVKAYSWVRQLNASDENYQSNRFFILYPLTLLDLEVEIVGVSMLAYIQESIRQC